ncbi:hypothetical protein ACLB2K_011455 [Fragaria x ananassa]
MEEHIGPSLIPPTNNEGLRTPPRMSKMAEGPRVLKKRPKLKLNICEDVDPALLTQQYNKWFPEDMLPFILGAKNVRDDGNCGFRAIDDFMGYCENNWRRVHLTPFHPMPPIVDGWFKHSLLLANGWLPPYSDRLLAGKDIFDTDYPDDEKIVGVHCPIDETFVTLDSD